MTVSMSAEVDAVAVFPGRPQSLHPTKLPIAQPGPGQAAVCVRRVGVCGTDKEIIDAKFGAPPPGSTELVIGHEVVGVVEAVGDGVTALAPGQVVIATVRRPDGCPACQAGQPDMCVWRAYTERGITGAHGFMAERFVEAEQYLIPVAPALEPIAVLVEPLSAVEKAIRQVDLIQSRLRSWQLAQALVLGAGPIGLLGTVLLRSRGAHVTVAARRPTPNPAASVAERCGGRYVSLRETTLAELAASLPPIDVILEATGVSSLVFDGMAVLGNNGVMVLLSVTGGTSIASVPIDLLNREFVLGNKVLVGSVNAAHKDFAAGVSDLDRFETLWPGLVGQLITHRLSAFEDLAQIGAAAADGIKTVVEFSAR